MSVSDASMFDDELKSLGEQIQGCLRAMDTLSGDARTDKYNRAQELIKSMTKELHHFRVEIRQLDGPEADAFQRKGREHNNLLTQLKEQLAAKRNEPSGGANGGAAGGAAGGGGGANYGAAGGYEPDGMDRARATKDRIANTQATSIKVLGQIEQTVQETQQVGDETAEKLATQTELMRRMNDKLDKLDGEVDRAKGELNAFIRRMMTDKIILCFILLIIIAVIIIVVVKLQGKDDDSPVPPPPLPPATTTASASTAAVNGRWI